MNEITCIGWGDPSNAGTWSNIPFYLLSSLENAGFVVHGVDLSKGQSILIRTGNLLNKIITKIAGKYLFFDYTRTRLYELIVNFKLRKIAQRFASTDVFICTSFSYNIKKYTSAKVVLLCDWTIEYAIKTFQKRTPSFLERRPIRQQHRIMNSADLVLTLFPGVYEFYQARKYPHIAYLGPVVNSTEISDSDLSSLIKRKFSSNRLLFIGKKSYLNGLLPLMSSVKEINSSQKLYLDIIGMDDFQKIPDEHIVFHGYLNKSNPIQKRKYQELLDNAKIIINVTPTWAGFSSILECMYQGTPVIVSKVENFVDIFGEYIDFGLYSDSNEEKLIESIMSILELDFNSFHIMASKAHEGTKDYLWASYIKKILSTIESSKTRQSD